MAYYSYLVLVACMYSWYIHTHLILYLKKREKKGLGPGHLWFREWMLVEVEDL
jgi:hypothetical protein